MKRRITQYLFNLLITLDQSVNTMAGGDPDETISSRLGKIERRYWGRIPWYLPITRSIVWLLNKLDPAHCQASIEEDEGENSTFNKSGDRHHDLD